MIYNTYAVVPNYCTEALQNTLEEYAKDNYKLVNTVLAKNSYGEDAMYCFFTKEVDLRQMQNAYPRKGEVNNILTKSGFTKESRSVDSCLDDVYEKCIKLSDEESSYYAYIAVNVNTNDVHIYVEYDCGGEVASYDEMLCGSNFEEDQKEYLDRLNSLAAECLQKYIVETQEWEMESKK